MGAVGGRRWLAAGEQEIVTLRPHAKVIAWPVILLLILAALFGAGLRAIPDDRPELFWVLAAVLGSASLLFVLRPLLHWRTTRYVFTDQRILTRRGVFGRVGRVIALRGIREVGYRRTLTDRLLGCGTLRLTTFDGLPLQISHVPDIRRVQLVLDELCRAQLPAMPARW